MHSQGGCTRWEAHDEVLARPVVVTLQEASRSEGGSGEEELRRRAASAARLAHPSIVATFDAGGDDDGVWVVTELAAGRTLQDLVRLHGPLAPMQVVAIGIQLADAVAHLHSGGVVHGAITPADICVTTDGRARLTGLATPLAENAVAPRDDVVGLGAALYHALCGQDAAGDTPERWPRPRRVRAGVPAPLEAAVLAAVEGSCSAADLRAALEGIDDANDAVPLAVPVSTPPEGIAAVAARRRPPGWLPIAMLAILTLSVVGVVAALVSSDDGPVSDPRQVGSVKTTPVKIIGVELFDPEGDGDEHTDEVGSAVDGNPTSTWSTHEYRGAGFGGLKAGVGLLFRLDTQLSLAQLQVSSPTRGWSAMVFVGNGREAALASWGRAAATVESAAGDVNFELDGKSGSAVLLWLTDPGATGQAVISEVRLTR